MFVNVMHHPGEQLNRTAMKNVSYGYGEDTPDDFDVSTEVNIIYNNTIIVINGIE